MPYQVLGPLRVTSAGGDVPVPARLSRTLCWLVGHANQPVSWATLGSLHSDRTLDDPAEVQPKVRRIVRELGPLLGDELDVTETHVCLSTDPDGIDAHRFERHVHDADHLLEAGAYDSGSSELDAALGLWRGDPYRELDRTVAALPLVDPLVELHHHAVEQLFGLRLRTGADYGLVAALTAEVTRHPDRPRLWRQLALALYRTGRQVDALQTISRRREAGDDVSEYALLQTAILQHDPRLELGELAH